MVTRGKGSVWAPEWKTSVDPVSGATIHQLTDYYAHSSHFYFTNPGWYDGGNKMLFTSQRENRTNLFSIDLRSGKITQLTDTRPDEGEASSPFVNPAKPEAIFAQGRFLKAINLETLEERTLYRKPDQYVGGGTNVTADGKYVCTSLVTDLSDRIYTDMGNGYIGFREWWEAHPPSKIIRVALDGSGEEVIYEEDYWLGHVNTSPKMPHILTFCHEGPWTLVENRIWGLDMTTGKTWQIRPNAPRRRGRRPRVLDGGRRAHRLPRPHADRRRVWVDPLRQHRPGRGALPPRVDALSLGGAATDRRRRREGQPLPAALAHEGWRL